MLVEVKVPMLAESVAEATLLNWHVKPGDAVKRGDPLIEIETDKVTLEVAAMNSGVLEKIIRQDGEMVASNEVIALIDTALAGKGQVIPRPEVAAPLQQSLPVGELPPQQPKMSPAVRGLLAEHNLKATDITATGEGNRLSREDVLRYLETRTGTPPRPQTASARVTTSTTPQQPASPPPPPQAPASQPENLEAAVTISAETPAESTGMIESPAEVAAGISMVRSEIEIAPPPVTIPPSAPTVESARAERRVAMTRLRQRTAERLVKAQRENAILTTFNEINMHAVVELRNRHKEEFERLHGIKLGFMSFFTRAVTESLKKYPIINASVEGKDIIYHGYFDIGVAVSTERGLVVPILRDADLMSLAEIEKKIREFGEKARSSKLTLEELTGGTFTITNGGVFGSLLSTPILNPPQSAILGMHAIQDRPVAEQGAVVIRPVMFVALSYDHRIIDGADAVSFLVNVKRLIEDPARLILQL
ncbi:MAG TPA: 2-oxoglutarate dehydrogenase complex dihydrolipoyllysine-residue succinyltransferase [Gammaproteobacteria bacterium]|nr:2-oxoglutarate dehydrogenase complex dihydrolipoyllysine-residue succinyltransferase [Gammaproteobacteria bacterium]